MPDMLATLDRWPRPWTWCHCATATHHVSHYTYAQQVPGCSTVLDANGVVLLPHIPEAIAILVAAAPGLVAALGKAIDDGNRQLRDGNLDPERYDELLALVEGYERAYDAATRTPPAGGDRE